MDAQRAVAEALGAVDALDEAAGGALHIDGRTLALNAPDFMNEICGRPLSRQTVRGLMIAQAQLLSFCDLHDALLDGEREVSPTELIPPLRESLRQLCSFFPSRDPFWNDFGRLIHQQMESTRWELLGKGRIQQRYGPSLLRALGRKLSLWRWPAAAVARLASMGGKVAFLDDILERFYRALQLLDDVTDVETDRTSGQTNAVLAATAMASIRRMARQVSTPAAMVVVLGAARAELFQILQHAPPGGRFARVCDLLAVGCAGALDAVQKLTALRFAEDLCGRTVAALMVGQSAPRRRTAC